MNNPIQINSDEIDDLIPHRNPFRWIDSVEILKVGILARGKKLLVREDACFAGHFPENPIFPGVLIVEAMAQTGAVLLNHGQRQTGLPLSNATPSNECGYLARVEVKFLKPVVPGATVFFEIRKIARVGNLFQLQCRAEVDGQSVAEGKISVSHPAGDGVN